MSGFLKNRCTGCGETIYIKADPDGVRRPYKSWVAGQVAEGEWELHECRNRPEGRPATCLPKASRDRTPAKASNAARAAEAVSIICEKYRLPNDIAVGVVGTVLATVLNYSAKSAGSSFR